MCRSVLYLQKCIGRGRTRDCWLHPLNENLCVKVNLENRKSNPLLYEIHVYECVKNLLPGLVAEIHSELVETDKGPGLVSRIVHDEDGKISPSLKEYAKNGGDMKEILAPLNRIIKRIIVRDIFFLDFNRGNFVVQTLNIKKKIIMIDVKSLNRTGFQGYLHLERIFAPLARIIMFRRIRRLYKELDLDFPYNELCRKKFFHTILISVK